MSGTEVSLMLLENDGIMVDVAVCRWDRRSRSYPFRERACLHREMTKTVAWCRSTRQIDCLVRRHRSSSTQMCVYKRCLLKYQSQECPDLPEAEPSNVGKHYLQLRIAYDRFTCAILVYATTYYWRRFVCSSSRRQKSACISPYWHS